MIIHNEFTITKVCINIQVPKVLDSYTGYSGGHGWLTYGDNCGSCHESINRI